MQERSLETEIASISNNSVIIPTEIKKINKKEYDIIITLPVNKFYTSKLNIQNDIIFIMNLKDNFSLHSPKLYSMTPFATPNLCDGRDLFEVVNKGLWTTSCSLVEVINSLPKFVIEYITSISNKNIPNYGKYHLDSKYTVSFFSKLPVYTNRVKQCIKLSDNKTFEEERYLMISDMFYCLFSYEIFNQNNIKLLFYANLNSLELMKGYIDLGYIECSWRTGNNKEYKMKIITEDVEKIINLITKNLKIIGINYSVKKRNLDSKEGEIPEVDIELVEKEIVEIEGKVENDFTPEVLTFLMDLYQRAIRYYSAINDDKYLDYMKKIHIIMNNEKYLQVFDGKKKESEEGKKNGKEVKEDKDKGIKENVNKWEQPKEIEKDELKTINRVNLEEQNEEYKIELNNHNIMNVSSLKISGKKDDIKLNFDLDDDD